jgi:hypothetical protein
VLLALLGEVIRIGDIPSWINIERGFLAKKLHQHRITARMALPVRTGSFQRRPANAIASQPFKIGAPARNSGPQGRASSSRRKYFREMPFMEKSDRAVAQHGVEINIDAHL